MLGVRSRLSWPDSMASLRVSNLARTTVAPRPPALPPRPVFETFEGSARALARELGQDVVELFARESEAAKVPRPHLATPSPALLAALRQRQGGPLLSPEAVEQQLLMARIQESTTPEGPTALALRAANPIDLDVEDPARTFSDAEKTTIWTRYDEIARRIASGQAPFSPHRSVLSNIHQIMFDGVKDYAGKIRSRDWGTEVIFVGPLRSLHRSEVEAALERLLRFLAQASRQLTENKALVLDKGSEADLSAIVAETCVVGAYAYLMLVQIQPFLDGNKRTSRLFIDTLLASQGLPPVMSEIPEQVYAQAIREFFSTRTTKILQTAMIDAANGLASELVPAEQGQGL